MATINKIDTTFSAKDIHTAASVYEYTADGTYRTRFQVQLTSLAGGGDYSVWLTLNDGDAVADNPIEPITKITLTAGAKSRWFVSGEVDVMTGDVINVFALGLAGDTAIAGIIRVFSDDMTGVTGAILGATQTGVTIPTVTTVTNAPTGMALEASLTAMKGAGWSDETLVKIVDDIAAISAGSGATAQEVWEYAKRTLTQSVKEIIDSVTGAKISRTRGNTWDIEIPDVTLHAHKQQFIIKKRLTDPDENALLFVDSISGLLVLNGVSDGLTAADASLTYVGTKLTLHLEAKYSAQLPGISNAKYGAQGLTVDGKVDEPYRGTFEILEDAVMATD